MDTKRYNGKIYSIRSYQTDFIYIGSTCETRLSARFCKHRADYKRFIENKYHYVSSFEIMMYSDAYIELIEEVEKKTKNELHKLEGEYIRQNNCVNKKIEGQTVKQYREANKGKISKKNKEYYIYNKDNIKENSREYYIKHKVKLNEQHKEYYEINKDTINEQQKEYYNINKTTIKERQSEQRGKKYTCDCGKSLNISSKLRHSKICKHTVIC